MNRPKQVQPSIMLDEFVECEAAVKASEEFRAAIADHSKENCNNGDHECFSVLINTALLGFALHTLDITSRSKLYPFSQFSFLSQQE